MLKTIATLIMSALRAIGGALRSVAAMPFRALAYLASGGSGAMLLPPDAPEYVPPPAPAADREADRKAAEKVALALQNWAGESVHNGAHLPLPKVLPRDVRDWCPGLTRAECVSLLRADERAITAHLQGLFEIPGVRKVRRLEPAAWGKRTSAIVADVPSFGPTVIPSPR